MDQGAQRIAFHCSPEPKKLPAATQTAVLEVVYSNLQRTIIDCIAKGSTLILSVSDEEPQIQSLPGRAVVSIPGDVQLVNLSRDVRQVLMNEEVYLPPTLNTVTPASGNVSDSAETGQEIERIEFQRETKTFKLPVPEDALHNGTWNCTCIYCQDTFSRPCPTFVKVQKEETEAKEKNAKKRPYKPDVKRALRAPCKICGKIVRNGSLKWHMQAHEGITYECPSCSKNFLTPFSRARHERDVHAVGRTKEIKCPHCPKQFYTQAALNVHSNQKHRGLFRFFCDVCSKGWYFANQLKEHQKVHTGEQPHVCPICSRGFRVRHGLNLHMKQHDPERERKGMGQKKKKQGTP